MRSGWNGWWRAVALSVVIGVIAGLCGWSAGVSAAAAEPWGPDPTFGDNGTARISVRSAPNESWDTPGDVVAQPDDRIVVVGSAGTSQIDTGDIAVLRRLADGRPDASFGNSGTTVIDFGGSEIGAGAVIQSDGKIVVVGGGGPGCTTVAARLRRDGTLDTGFGSGGKVTLPAAESCYRNAAVALQSDGRIVIMGARRLVRLTTAGTIDPTFGADGVVALPDGLTARAIAVQADGAMLVAGEGGFFGLYRYRANGTLDTSFGNGGLASVPAQGNTFVNAIAIEADGDVVAGGAEYMGEYVFRLARWSPTGDLDTGFGRDGQVRTSFYDIGNSGGTPVAELISLVALPNGKLMASGVDVMDQAFARYNADGSLDPTFGAGGRLDLIVDNYADGAEGMALQSDGGIVTLGRYSGVKFHLTLTRLSTGPIGTATTTTRPPATTTTTVTSPPNPTTSTTTTTSTTGPTGAGPTSTTTTTLPASTQPDPAAGTAASPARSGYWAAARNGQIYSFGDAAQLGHTTAGVVDFEPTPIGSGYWTLNENGHVQAFGDAARLGNVEPGQLSGSERPASLSATPTGKGYWVFTDRGRAIAFGDARFLGDVSTVKLNGPVLGSVATPSGKGYYMVASDGGIFTFGDAAFLGSMGGTKLNAPVQSLVPDSDGKGYWLVASDGGIFAFDAPFKGSLGDVKLNKAVVGMVRYGDGYLMVGADGGIFNFSTSPFAGSLGDKPPASPVVAVAALP